ncbi:hypothetical protein D6827_03515, partial [Candidatus Parcubacteria bacterium]
TKCQTTMTLNLPSFIKLSSNASEANIANRRHPLYEKRIDDWRFFWLSYKGGRDYIESGYLWPHEFEKNELFNARLERAYYTNYCKPVVNLYSNYLFQQPVRRQNLAIADDIINNISGTNIKADTFFKKLAKYAYIFGYAYVFVDMPFVDDSEANPSRLFDRQLRPIARILKPSDVVDWSLKDGNYRWILIQQLVDDDENPLMEREISEIYKLWTPDEITIFDENGNVMRKMPNPLGYIPIISFSHTEYDDLSNTQSLIEDISHINNAIFNYSSLIDEMFFRNTFSQMIVQGDPEFYDEQIIGLAYAFNYPEGVNPPQFIAPPADPAQLIEAKIENLILEIYRIAQLRARGRKETGTYKSILELSFDFHDTNTSLSISARRLEQIEKKTWSVFYDWLKLSANKDIIEISYPAEFDVATIDSDLANVLDISRLGITKKYREFALKRILGKKYPDLNEDQIQELIGDPDFILTNQGLGGANPSA